MRYTNCQYLEKEQVTVSICNLNAANAILDGQVVFAISFDTLTTYISNTSGQIGYNNNELGVAVQTASDIVSNTTNPNAFCIGIAKVNNTNTSNTSNSSAAQVPVLGVSEAVCYGFTDAIVQRRTRANSTSAWATQSAIAAGDQLVPESVNGYLVWSGTQSLGAFQSPFAAAQSAASLPTYASNSNPNAASTATVETTRMKVRVCLM